MSNSYTIIPPPTASANSSASSTSSSISSSPPRQNRTLGPSSASRREGTGTNERNRLEQPVNGRTATSTTPADAGNDGDVDCGSYGSAATSDSYDSSGESLDRITPFSFASRPTPSAAEGVRRTTGLGIVGSGSEGIVVDEKEYYSDGPAWEGYRPNLVSYRTGAMSSRRGSRNVSGTVTPIPNDKLERDGEYFESHHYQTSALLTKLARPNSSSDSSVASTPKKRRAGWWSRRAESRRKSTPTSPSSGPLLPSSSSSSLPSSARSSRRRSTCFGLFVPALFRQPWFPTQPLTILFTLLLFGCFAATITTLLVNILSTDKQPLPWRTFCQEQRAFPHALADSLAPVNVLVGVFSFDSAYERRNLIRSTYVRHTMPIDPRTGRPGSNVQVRFILGRPRESHAKRVALEMETFNDIVILDMAENMNRGKTHAYFRWANENATVPIYYQKQRGGVEDGHGASTIGVGFKKVDYVVKADDDAFLVLSELERHLRVSPREKTYWGYLIRNLFMAGEAYALSSDLVQYIATHEPLLDYTAGAEDKRVAKWMRLHPEASSINWITERCWVYDHPKAGTTYSHGFLFPDQVAKIREEGRIGISDAEKVKRGGERYQSYSTVSTWKGEYRSPAQGMSVEEEIESLIEGGGRWSANEYKTTESESVRWDTLVFERDDHRLADTRYQNYGDLPTQASTGVTPGVPDRSIHLPNARTSTKFSKDFYRDPSDVEAVQLQKRSTAYEGETDDSATPHNRVTPPPLEPEDQLQLDLIVPTSPYTPSRTDSTPTVPIDDAVPVDNRPTVEIRLPAKNYLLPGDASRLVSPPTLRYDPSTLTLRERRMQNRPHGGTVAVHFLKTNEWFLETALALLGRDKTWDSGVEAPVSSSGSAAAGADASQVEVSRLPPWAGVGMISAVDSLWGGARLYGSPIVRENGYICEGRLVEEGKVRRQEYIPNEPTEELGRLGRGKAPKLAIALREGIEIESGVGAVQDEQRVISSVRTEEIVVREEVVEVAEPAEITIGEEDSPSHIEPTSQLSEADAVAVEVADAIEVPTPEAIGSSKLIEDDSAISSTPAEDSIAAPPFLIQSPL